MPLILVHHYNAVIRDMSDAVHNRPIAPARYVDGWRAALKAHDEAGCVFTTAHNPTNGEIRHFEGGPNTRITII